MENKTGRYLKYAIGEIILVVIGILIALQINNWNETRKLNAKVNSVYNIIKTDLLSDIKAIDNVLIQVQSNDTIFKKVLNKTMTYQDYQNCEDCYILGGFPDLKLRNRGLKLLETNSIIFDNQNDSLINKINDFYSYFNTELDIAISEAGEDFRDNYSYFKNNMSWFVDYYNKVKNEDFITYALTPHDYRNRVRSFYLLFYQIYLGHLKDYKKDALVLIDDIDKLVG